MVYVSGGQKQKVCEQQIAPNIVAANASIALWSSYPMDTKTIIDMIAARQKLDRRQCSPP